MGLVKDIGKEQEEDPIMKLNPTLYKVVQARQEDNFTDPFKKIMDQQHQWMQHKEANPMVKNFIYRTEYDHPHSLHNTTTN